MNCKRTRPDTRPSVADGWAGAEIRVFPLFNSSVTDQRTDQRTDGRTDKASYIVATKKEIGYEAAETRQDTWSAWLLLDGHEWRIPNKPDWAKKRLD